jgi:ATP-dependent DNA helicase DinG
LDQLTDYFAESGLLASMLPGFTPRSQQVEMAQTVQQAISDSDIALIEAGTGTGKTFAYLVPVFCSGKKTIISTGTKTLQDQLHFQDLPLIRKLFPAHRIALLKGRSNYLCPHRLEQHLKVMVSDTRRLAGLVEVRTWSLQTTTGDLNELPMLDNGVLPLVTSTRDNCLAGQCPRFDQCPLYKARQQAQDADIVIVNHHLLFADLALKEDSIASLLPAVETVVVDEAHQVQEIARQFFGASVSSRRFTDLIRDLRSEMFLLGNDDFQLIHNVAMVESVVGEMAAQLESAEAGFDRWYQRGGQAVVERVDHALTELLNALGPAAIRSQGLENARRRTGQLVDEFVLLTEPASLGEYIHWIENQGSGFTIHLSPVSIADTIGPMFRKGETSWVFSSATLCVEQSFEHIQRSLGIDGATTRQLSSPFDFMHQAKAWLPEGLPVPGSEQHTLDLVESVMPVLLANKGKTFFLFTSYRAMHLAQTILKEDFNILVQGSMSRHELLSRFREIERSILLATHSFWQGVDVRGAGLTTVIIDKLPFASPEDPLHQATMQALALSGGDGFVDYLLPQAIISLKQGFGRLIRSESDQGIFVLGDPRIRTRAYGSMVLASLPEMQWVGAEEARRYVEEISEHPGN